MALLRLETIVHDVVNLVRSRADLRNMYRITARPKFQWVRTVKHFDRSLVLRDACFRSLGIF